jgi:V8-like Glu-specific endopeptidase
MRNHAISAIALIIVLPTFALPAYADRGYFIRNNNDLELMQVSQLPHYGRSKVINGTPAQTTDFPASFYQSSGAGRCTATLIGPRVLLTAAHCVRNGGSVKIRISATTFKGKCTHHEEWQDGDGDRSADYSLCLLDKEIAGVAPERLDLNGGGMKVGGNVLLAGYGCTQENMSGGNDGIFRIGLAKISALPGYDAARPNDMLAKSSLEEQAPAIVCPGDSGGSVYHLKSKMSVAGSRSIVAINSRVGLESDTKVNGFSYLVATFTDPFKAFVKKWSNKNKVQICGISKPMSVVCHQ